jgi:hypothetical protein
MVGNTNGQSVSGAGEPSDEILGNVGIDNNASENTISGNDDSIKGVNPAAITEQKRGRGRPFGSSKKAESRSGNKAKGSAKRASGTYTSSAESTVEATPYIEKTKVNPDFVSFVLYSMHEMAGVAFQANEFKLTEQEAMKLGAASANVLEIYNVKLTPAQEAWGMLIQTCFVVYQPKIMAIKKRRKEEKEAKKTGAVMPSP